MFIYGYILFFYSYKYWRILHLDKIKIFIDKNIRYVLKMVLRMIFLKSVAYFEGCPPCLDTPRLKKKIKALYYIDFIVYFIMLLFKNKINGTTK
jgi:hypothetical protein